MKTSSALSWCALFIAVSLGLAAWYFGRLPDTIPTHWGPDGQPNQWSSKGPVLFLMPGIMVAMTLLIPTLPYLSPKGFKMEGFLPVFNYLMVLLMLMFGVMNAVILYNTAHPFWNGNRWLLAPMFLILGLIGNLLGKTDRNFFVGIRTPWTLASDKVWRATHRLGAKMFVIGGFVSAALVLVGMPVMPVLMIFLAATLWPVVYSFLLYKRLERANAL